MKKKIEAEKGKDYACENQKLIYAGEFRAVRSVCRSVVYCSFLECNNTCGSVSSYCFYYLGKILDDEKTIDSYKIEEKNFVVIMVTKVSFSVVFLLCDQ